jgi:putative transposase
MSCPHCSFSETTPLSEGTSLGYIRFQCQHCHRTFNERTGTEFNFLEVPTDIVFQVLIWRFRYKLSLRNLAEMFLLRGFQFTHETVRDWEERFGDQVSQLLRRKRRRRAGRVWRADETYIKVRGKWVYLYRAIDSSGELVDMMLSERRDLAAAKGFFRSAQSVVGQKPKRVITDGHTAYRRAIRETLGKKVEHQVCRGCVGNSEIEQDHRGIKQRYYPTLGYKGVESARRFCRVCDEVRNYFRPRTVMGEEWPWSHRREKFVGRYLRLQDQFCLV